jgi:hypothetical protein
VLVSSAPGNKQIELTTAAYQIVVSRRKAARPHGSIWYESDGLGGQDHLQPHMYQDRGHHGAYAR